jgi:hypothetical protein
MTGSDLIVAAPWIAFAIGLAVLVVRLLCVRHGGRHRNHQLPLPQRTITCSRKRARHLRPR